MKLLVAEAKALLTKAEFIVTLSLDNVTVSSDLTT